MYVNKYTMRFNICYKIQNDGVGTFEVLNLRRKKIYVEIFVHNLIVFIFLF